MRRPPLHDLLLAAAFLAAGVAAVLTTDGDGPLVPTLLLTAAYALPLAVRRQRPLEVVAVVAVTICVLGAVDDRSQPTLPFAVLLALFSAGRHLPAPRTYAAPVAGVGSVWTAALLMDEATATDLGFMLVFFTAAWAIGRVVRVRGAQAAAAEARAERAVADREAAEAAAVAAERARIARELHDVVSHSISVVAVQAQAVRRRLGDEHPREAADLRAIETTAREAMAEMRRLFGVLRAPDGAAASLAPQPGLDQLGRLLDDVRTAGLPVDLELDGERRPLPPGLDLAAYRIVQEALTNVRRHAGATRARVLLRFADARVEVEVRDDGRGTAANGSGPAGHGLVGMRERVALYHGTLEAGDDPDGGFRVRAVLPLGEPVAA